MYRCQTEGQSHTSCYISCSDPLTGCRTGSPWLWCTDRWDKNSPAKIQLPSRSASIKHIWHPRWREWKRNMTRKGNKIPAPSFPLSYPPRSVCSAHFATCCHSTISFFFFHSQGAIFITLNICITKGGRPANLKKGEGHKWAQIKTNANTLQSRLSVQSRSQQDVWYFGCINGSGTGSAGSVGG